MVMESRIIGSKILTRNGFAIGNPQDISRALLLAGNLFLLLATYYVLKTVREALILTEGGAEIKSYATAVQALLMLAILPLYGAAARRVCGISLVRGITLLFILQLLVFSIFGMAGVQVGHAFFLWVGVFVIVIAQCWAFAGDLLPGGQGKRAFWMMGFGGATGAWTGSWLAANWFAAFGPYRMMLLAAALLFGSILLGCRSARSSPEVGKGGGASGDQSKPQPAQWRRYLLLIALLTILMNLVSSTGEYIFSKLVMIEADRVIGSGVEAEVQRQAFVGQFYARFFGWTNLLGILLQLVCVPLILRRMCLPAALFILPAVTLAGYGALAAAPLLGLVQITKLLENSTDHSIQNTAVHALFLPAGREVKYQGQTVLETVFARLGDLLHALLIFLGSRFAFGITSYASINLILTVAALLLVAVLYRENQKAAVWS